MGELVAFRALQGIGAGGLMVGAQAIIADIVPPRDRGRYMGLIGSVFAVASVAGPLLGGFLVESLSWRWVFYVNLPIGVVAVLVVVFRLHLHTPPQRHAIDYLGATLLTAGVSALILAHHVGRQRVRLGLGGRSSACWSPRVALLAAFVWQERRAAEPIIPLSLFGSGVFRVASALGFVIGLAMFGAIIFIPLFLQLVYGVSPTSSGLRMLPLMAGLLDAPAIALRARDHPRSAATRRSRSPARRSPRRACSCCRGCEVDTPPWLASAYMLVVGVGIGLVMQVLVLVVQNDAPRRDVGRRHLDRDLLPVDGRLARRRRSSGRSSRRASPTSSRRCPAPPPRTSPAASTCRRRRCTRCPRVSATTSWWPSSMRCSRSSSSGRC